MVEPMARIDRIYGLLNKRFRAKRMLQFQQQTGVTEDTRVLDVGGAPGIWTLAPCRPKLTMVNIAPTGGLDGAVEVIADGTRLPFRDQSFDLVFSNSVIEHVGTAQAQQAFADEIRRVGRAFYVQTPNRWFPLEPHLLTPLVHFLPKNWRRKLIRNFTVWGMITRPSRQSADAFVDSTRLLGARELNRLLPSGRIQRERFVGLTKSIISWTPPCEASHSAPASPDPRRHSQSRL